MSKMKLGHYEILDLLGKGGMGEVHRARDTKLGREVALKLLPLDFATDPERVARFRREAKLLASLNHPNIAGIHGLEEEDGQHFLVMELADGEDLAERLKRGRIPVPETLKIARQLADGIEAAHEKGVVHRDLKPANIMLSGDGKVKILDFGLARAYSGEGAEEGDLANSPTITAAMTQQGMILGTAAYMSPEQARGQTADRRADIWAFGTILYEMLSGAQAFSGNTVSDTLASVLARDPDWSLLPEGLPPELLRLLQRCLQREREDRLRDIGDARLTVREVQSGDTTMIGIAASARGPRSRGTSWIWIASTLLFAALAALALFGPLRPSSSPPPLRKWAIALQAPQENSGAQYAPRISPNGKSVVYVQGGKLWIQDLDGIDPRPLEGTERAHHPIWSPDSEGIAFLRDRNLFRMSREGGSPALVTSFRAEDGVGGTVSGAWNTEGWIAIGTGVGGLLGVPSQGGAVTDLLEVGPNESDFHEVCALPDSRGWVFVVHRNEGAYGFLDLLTADGERRTLVSLPGEVLSDPQYSPSGHLLFRRGGVTPGIWAVEFDLGSLKAGDAPFLVTAGGRMPSVADDGTLCYLLSAATPPAQLTVVDREGQTIHELAPVETTRPYPSYSPDGKQIVLAVTMGEHRELVVYDAEVSGRERRLTFTEISEEMGTWSPDGQAIYAYHGAPYNTYRIPLDAPQDTTLACPGIMAQAYGDGSSIVYAGQGQGGFNFDIFRKRLDQPDSEPIRLVKGPGINWWPRVSPDGKFLLYTSDESGRTEVFLTTLEASGSRWEVSRGAGEFPCWKDDGTEIYYATRGTIWVVDVQLAPGLSLSPPRKLFDRRPINWSDSWVDGFDARGDGERFTLVQARSMATQQPDRLVLVQSWYAEFAH